MLPGGKYWEPDQCTKAVLQPSNDLCESILGLNDHLTTAIPNLHQLSNLIQVKKNKTIEWFRQHSIVELAVRRSAEVAKRYKEEEAIRSLQRREKMLRDKHRRDAFLRWKKMRLSNLHLITTTDEEEM